MTFRPSQPALGHSIQFGSERPQKLLRRPAAAANDMANDVYATSRRGQFLVFVLDDGGDPSGATLSIWPSRKAYESWSPRHLRPLTIRGSCKSSS
jgi:hypothetical protein